MADNARVKREKPPLCFAELFKGGWLIYRAFYSLSRIPFSKENANYFVSKSFGEARARLEYLQKTRGMGLQSESPVQVKLLCLNPSPPA